MDAQAIIAQFEADATRLFSVLTNLIKLNKLPYRKSAIPFAIAVEHDSIDSVLELLEKLGYAQYRKNSLNAKEFSKNGYGSISVGYDLVRVSKGTKELAEVPQHIIQQFQKVLADFNAGKRAVDKTTIEFKREDTDAVRKVLDKNFKKINQDLYEQDDCYYTLIDNSVYLRTRPHIEIGSLDLDLDF